MRFSAAFVLGNSADALLENSCNHEHYRERHGERHQHGRSRLNNMHEQCGEKLFHTVEGPSHLSMTVSSIGPGVPEEIIVRQRSQCSAQLCIAVHPCSRRNERDSKWLRVSGETAVLEQVANDVIVISTAVERFYTPKLGLRRDLSTAVEMTGCSIRPLNASRRSGLTSPRNRHLENRAAAPVRRLP
ncbi:hypothetical protein BH23CHL1_BH23CHL1_18730 [soil metagenome]